MKRLLISFFLLLLFGTVAALYRILFLINWIEPTPYLSYFFAIGVAYDLLVVAELSFVALLLAWLFRKKFALILTLLSAVWVIFNFTNYTYFEEFRSHIPFSALMYAGIDEWQYMQGSYLAIFQSWEFFTLCLLPLIITTFAIRYWKLFSPPGNRTIAVNLGVLCIIALGSGAFANSNVENFVHPIQNNGLFYFLARTSGLVDTTTPLSVPYKELESWRIHETELRQRKQIELEYPFLYMASKLPKNNIFREAGLEKLFEAKRPNIIIIISESFNADRIGAYNPASNLTPNFDRLAQKGILFENFYANSYQTMRGQFAIFCGLFPNPGHAVFRFYHQTSFNCLPKILSSKGYSTSWIFSHAGNFDNQSFFHSVNGFDQIVTELDFGPEIEKLAWGPGDHELMKKAITIIRTQEEPFFSVILTTTNHHPFSLPKNYTPAHEDAVKSSATVRYADYAIGLFFELAEKEEFFDNTIVLITADTGSSLLSGGSNLNDPIGLPSIRIPLLIYWQGTKSFSRVATFSSQVDIAPTITDLLGYEEINHFVGQSLRRQYENRMFVRSGPNELQVFYNQTTVDGQKQHKPVSNPEFHTSLQKIITYAYQNNKTWKSISINQKPHKD